MKGNPLYNGQNLAFTGSANPYGLIQNGGLRRRKKVRTNKRRTNKMNKKRRNAHTKKRYNR